MLRTELRSSPYSSSAAPRPYATSLRKPNPPSPPLQCRDSRYFFDAHATPHRHGSTGPNARSSLSRVVLCPSFSFSRMALAMNRIGWSHTVAAVRGPAKIWNTWMTTASAAAVAATRRSRTYFTYTPQVSQVLDREPKWVSADEAVQCIKSGIVYVSFSFVNRRVVVVVVVAAANL